MPEFQTILGKKIRISGQYWNLILKAKHPEAKRFVKFLPDVLAGPDQIRVSKVDSKVLLFYKQVLGYYFCVVVKIKNQHGFIITFYPTKKIMEGELKWKK